jgi:hypothetical protein
LRACENRHGYYALRGLVEKYCREQNLSLMWDAFYRPSGKQHRHIARPELLAVARIPGRHRLKPGIETEV